MEDVDGSATVLKEAALAAHQIMKRKEKEGYRISAKCTSLLDCDSHVIRFSGLRVLKIIPVLKSDEEGWADEIEIELQVLADAIKVHLGKVRLLKDADRSEDDVEMESA